MNRAIEERGALDAAAERFARQAAFSIAALVAVISTGR